MWFARNKAVMPPGLFPVGSVPISLSGGDEPRKEIGVSSYLFVEGLGGHLIELPTEELGID